MLLHGCDGWSGRRIETIESRRQLHCQCTNSENYHQRASALATVISLLGSVKHHWNLADHLVFTIRNKTSASSC